MNIIDYFKYIAIHLKVLKHRDGDEADIKAFMRTSGLGEMDELLQSPNCKDLILVVEDAFDGSYQDPGNNVLDNRIGVFYVLKRVNDAQDFTMKQAALLECQATVKKILARMRLDAERWTENTKLMRGFDMNTVRYYSIGPVASGWHGIHVSFELCEPASIVEDANNWTGE